MCEAFYAWRLFRAEQYRSAQCASAVTCAYPGVIPHMIEVSGRRSVSWSTFWGSNRADPHRPHRKRHYITGSLPRAHEPERQPRPAVDRKPIHVAERAGPQVSRREAIFATGSVLAAGACQPLAANAAKGWNVSQAGIDAAVFRSGFGVCIGYNLQGVMTYPKA